MRRILHWGECKPSIRADAELRAVDLLSPRLQPQPVLENIGNTNYQVNLAGTGTATLISFGTPRTVRVGVEAFRY